MMKLTKTYSAVYSAIRSAVIACVDGPKQHLLLEGREWKYHRKAFVKAMNYSRTMEKAKEISVQAALHMADSLRAKCLTAAGTTSGSTN